MMHLKSAQALVFIQERIVFLTDLSPALLLLPKDKLGPFENKAVATVFNRFALAYIYIGQASPSPGPAACAHGRKPGGGEFIFFFLSVHLGLIYRLKEIFLLQRIVNWVSLLLMRAVFQNWTIYIVH